jgi:hypothetical protein
MLAMNRRLLAYHEQVQTRLDWRWNEVRDVQRLAGRTLGLIGLTSRRRGDTTPGSATSTSCSAPRTS